MGPCLREFQAWSLPTEQMAQRCHWAGPSTGVLGGEGLPDESVHQPHRPTPTDSLSGLGPGCTPSSWASGTQVQVLLLSSRVPSQVPR